MSEEGKSQEERISFVESLKQQWMATVDAIIDPVMIVRQDYTIAQANKAMAQHASMNIKELKGKTCYKVFAKRKSPCPGCPIKDNFESSKPISFELSDKSSGKFFEVTSQAINDNGGINGSLQIYRDRTLAKQLQKQLLQSEKLASIGLLAGGIAHELNNPLGGVLAFSQMLNKEIDPKHPHKEYAEEIEAAAQRCKSIVNSLLEFARNQPASHEETLKAMDIIPCIKSAVKFGTVGDNSKNIEIVENFTVDKIFVLGNRNKAIQLLLNLIQNAIHAMPNGGTLSLNADQEIIDDTPHAVITVADTGVGIAEDELSQIFDPFYTSKAEGEGTGLGLSICHGIAEDMKGRIEVDSIVNKGSTFRIMIPSVTQGGTNDI